MSIGKAIPVLFVAALVFMCQACEKQELPVSESTQEEAEIKEEPQEIPSICLCDGRWLVDLPTYKENEYTAVTELALGEVVNWTGKEVEGDNSDGTKKFSFVEVVTIDGKSGWIWSRYIARNARPAAIVAKTSVYIKPSITSRVREQPLMPLDIIAVIEENGEWLKIYSETEGSSKEWWIENAHLSYDNIDVNTAVLGKRALAITTPKERIEAIERIIGTDSLQGSVFIDMLEGFLNSVSVKFSARGIANDNDVMLRNSPDLKAQVVGRLKKDERVTIYFRTKEKMVIDQMQAYWYQVQLESGIEGWAYGYFIDIE